MEIYFPNKKLQKLIEDERRCHKELGDRRATLLQRRIAEMYIAETLEDLRFYPGHYHELKENRKGQWACDLDQPYRLIFEPHESPIPTDEAGKYIWIEIKEIDIIEIVNYHE